MHSKARLKKLKMVGCWRIDVELYENFYAKLGWIGIDYQYQSIDKLVLIGIDWL